MTHALIGFADPVGLGAGFLVPVFERTGSNALFVQKLNRDSIIAGFEALDDYEGPIAYVDREPVAKGEPHFWAFTLPSRERIVGRGNEAHDTLQAWLGDGTFDDRPMLAVEVSEFLKLGPQRLHWAGRVVDRLGGPKAEVASSWRDLTILTPDVREQLCRDDDRLTSWAHRLVATEQGGQIVIRGLVGDPGSREADAVARAARVAISRLAAILPTPAGGWRVRIDPLKPRMHIRQPDVAVFFFDVSDYGAIALLERAEGLKIAAFGFNERREFLSELERDVPAFAVLRNHPDEARHDLEQFLPSKVTGILLTPPSRSYPRDGRSQPELRHQESLILTQATSRIDSSRGALSTASLIREIVTGATLINDLEARFLGEWSYIRAQYPPRERSMDPWAYLYDRIWSDGCDPHTAILLGQSEKPDDLILSDLPADWTRFTLYPEAKFVNAGRMFASENSNFPRAAAFLPRRAPLEGAAGRQGQAIQRVLSARGWSVLGSSRADEAIEFEVDGADKRIQIKLEPAAAQRTTDVTSSLPDIDIDELRSVSVVPNAHAGTIMGYLRDRSELAVSMRDLCESDGSMGFRSLLAVQIRRFANMTPNRSPTFYMALLLKSALRAGAVTMSDAHIVSQILQNEELGRRFFLTWGRTRTQGSITQVTARLVERLYPYEHEPSLRHKTVNVIEPFGVAIHPNQIAFDRSES